MKYVLTPNQDKKVEFSQLNHRIRDVKLQIEIMEGDDMANGLVLADLKQQLPNMVRYRDFLENIAHTLNIKL